MSLQTALMRSDTDELTPTVAVGMLVVPATDRTILTATPPDGLINTSVINQYGFAVCVSLNPFIIVSELGDMRWSKLSASQFVAIGKANAATMEVANSRLSA